MNKKTILIIISVAIVVGVCSFYLGTVVSKGKTTSSQSSMFSGGNFSGRGGTARSGNSFNGGTIISKDNTSITVQSRDGSSKIIFFTANTPVMKMVAGTSNDLIAGQDITITGAPNTDGSISAESIQIRPAMNSNQTPKVNN